MFIENLKETLNEDFNISITENGAYGYKTSGKELLDINFSISSMREMSETQIIDKFVRTFYENKMLAVKWLFYARDIREGVGERRLFRICIKYLAQKHMDIAKAVISLVPEYGRYDDLLCMLDTSLAYDILGFIKIQLDYDIKNMNDNKPVSLLAKWLPSVNTSSNETKRFAHIIISGLKITEKQYRKILSKLRSYIGVTEVYMSKGKWKYINYEAVPSRANLIYSAAFLRNDKERRIVYLNNLQKRKVKINSGVLFPHDIVHKYYEETGERYYLKLKSSDDMALEEMWKALPDFACRNENTICVADGSGSMTYRFGSTNIMALDVANALAIYFAERSSGRFKNKYITFSENPVLVDFSNAASLREKLEIALSHSEIANTNIEAVFELILKTAVTNNMIQDELPQNILILSDMEFDDCVSCNDGFVCKEGKRLFEIFEVRYAKHGYRLPRLVFWNISSRTETIPVKENDLGVALVSGFSPAVIKMVLSNNIDPLKCLLEQINSKRYIAVENAVKKLVI